MSTDSKTPVFSLRARLRGTENISQSAKSKLAGVENVVISVSNMVVLVRRTTPQRHTAKFCKAPIRTLIAIVVVFI